MATQALQIIRRPIITEKGLGVKETQHTVVFEVAPTPPRRRSKKPCSGFSR